MRGIVLNRYKQSETSLLLKIFMEEMGLITVYIRGGLKRKAIPEIGDLLEAHPKRRGVEGLYSLYQFDIVHKYTFPTSLEIQTFRDIIFEVLSTTLPEEEAQLPFFATTLACLDYFDKGSLSTEESYFGLWLWLYRYTQSLGLEHDFLSCSQCGKDEVVTRFSASDIGAVCADCGPKLHAFSPELVLALDGRSSVESLVTVTERERLHFTSVMVRYIHKNLSISTSLRSLEFLGSLLGQK